MATPQRLQSGSITPSARPVDTFLSFDSNSQPAAPTRPSLLPQTPRVTTLQRGGQRNVQGVNPLEELTNALKPLSKLYDAGAEMYASDQYQRGQNEILKAAANVSRDTIRKSLEYAEQNRQVDSSNPIAGVLMDQSNPFRQAGRINQASQWVSTMAKPLFRAEWASRAGELQNVDPTSPAVMQVQAQATSRLANAFGLDEFSPGFQQYVVPEVNKQWEWFADKQFTAFTKAQKDKGTEQLAGSIQSMMIGQKDPSVDMWDALVKDFTLQYGLAGEPIDVQKKAVLKAASQLAVMSRQGDQRQLAALGLKRLRNMPSPIVIKENGVEKRLTMGEWLGAELIAEEADVAKDVKTLSDNDAELRLRDSEQGVASPTGATGEAQQAVWTRLRGLNPGDPGWEMAIEEIVVFTGLPRWRVQKRAMEIRKENTELQEALWDPDDALALEASAYNQMGTDWDENKFRGQWAQATRNIPQSQRSFWEQKLQTVIRAKRAEQAAIVDTPVMNRAIDDQMQYVIEQQFPASGPALLAWIQRNPNANVVDYLGQLPAAKAKKLRDLYTQFGIDGRKLIAEEYTRTKQPVPAWRQQEIWRDLFKSWRDANPKPATESKPAGGGPDRSGTANPDNTATAPPRTYYDPGQAVPMEFIKTNKSPYRKNDVGNLIAVYAKSGRLNNNVKRTARMSGKTPGQYLLMLGDAWGLQIPDATRKKILSFDNRSQGFTNSLIGMAPGDGPMAQATGITFNILTGRAPSYRRFTG